MGRVSTKLAMGLLFGASIGVVGFGYGLYRNQMSKGSLYLEYPSIEELPTEDRLNEKKRLEVEMHQFKKKWREQGSDVLASIRKEGKEFLKNKDSQGMEMPAEGQMILDIINDTKTEKQQ